MIKCLGSSKVSKGTRKHQPNTICVNLILMWGIYTCVYIFIIIFNNIENVYLCVLCVFFFLRTYAFFEKDK